MLKKLNNNPLPASWLVLFLYAGWFVLPTLFVKPDPDQHGISGIDGVISQWSNEAIIAISLIIIVSLLGWWRKIDFQHVHQGGGEIFTASCFTRIDGVNHFGSGFTQYTRGHPVWLIYWPVKVYQCSLFVQADLPSYTCPVCWAA